MIGNVIVCNVVYSYPFKYWYFSNSATAQKRAFLILSEEKTHNACAGLFSVKTDKGRLVYAYANKNAFHKFHQLVKT